MNSEIKQLLEEVRNGKVSVEEALLQIKKQPFEDLGFAKVDLHRKLRQGTAEVIYGAGKTVEQICGIINSMKVSGQKNILITRLDEEKAREVNLQISLDYKKDARIGIVGDFPEKKLRLRLNSLGTL